jgi:hypothetical protein
MNFRNTYCRKSTRIHFLTFSRLTNSNTDFSCYSTALLLKLFDTFVNLSFSRGASKRPRRTPYWRFPSVRSFLRHIIPRLQLLVFILTFGAVVMNRRWIYAQVLLSNSLQYTFLSILLNKKKKMIIKKLSKKINKKKVLFNTHRKRFIK